MRFDSSRGGRLPRENTGEGLFGFEWVTTRLWNIRFRNRLTAHPNLVQTGRYRIEFDSSIRVPLILGFAWQVSFFDRFDSAPPGDDVGGNDYGLQSTLGYSF